jgi:hypothetical protein
LLQVALDHGSERLDLVRQPGGLDLLEDGDDFPPDVPADLGSDGNLSEHGFRT